MLFGHADSFAVEAIVEAGHEYPPFFGSNIAGRFRLFFGGLEVGDFSEPCCVLRPLSHHLATMCVNADALWHDSLAGKAPQAMFEILDDSLYICGVSEPPEAYHRLSFLTNISEALNNVKGFLVVPPGEELHVLLKFPDSGAFHHKRVPLHEFRLVSSSFLNWVTQQEHEYLPRDA